METYSGGEQLGLGEADEDEDNVDDVLAEVCTEDELVIEEDLELEVELGEVEDIVEDNDTDDEIETEDDDLTVEEDDDADTALHCPKPDWQPVPQYGVVLPQYPYCEQQFPNLEPLQVNPPFAPCVLPQRALVETSPEEEGAAELEETLAEVGRVAVDKVVGLEAGEDEVIPAQVPARGLQPTSQWFSVRPLG